MSSARLPVSERLEAITPASATPRTDPSTPIHPAIITATAMNQPALRTIAIAHLPIGLSCKETPFSFSAIVADPPGPGQSRRASFEDADRHHDHRLAGKDELFLCDERRLVVEQLVEEILLLEDELPGEEDDVGEICRDIRRHPLESLDHVRAHAVPRLRVVAVPLHELDVIRELPPQVFRQVLDLRHPLEPAGVDHSHGQEEEV